MSSNSEGKVKKSILDAIKNTKIQNKDELFLNIAEPLVEQPKGIIEEIIYPIASQDTLKELIKELKSKGTTSYHKKIHYIIRDSYSCHYRRMLPEILQRLEFRSNNDYHKPIIEGLSLIKSSIDEKHRYFTIEEESKIDSLLRAP